jgi:cyclopropane fatty-acyl-phospholipid synthase-like methyltransferase
MMRKPVATAAERNSHAILGVIREELQRLRSVLEIGSGTGQHAVYFCGNLPHLDWQTSDVASNHDAINAWVDDASLDNIRRPLPLDVLDAETPGRSYDAVFSANTAHIMSMEAVASMFRVVAEVLEERGIFMLYGPFRQAGRFNTLSNEQFDLSLRQQDAARGVRDLEELDELAVQVNLRRLRLYAMPANNHLVVWGSAGGAQP